MRVCVRACVCTCFVYGYACFELCIKVDAVYNNLMLFQVRYIILTCILHVTVRQQLCVVTMYVGCITTQQFDLLFDAKLLAATLRVQRHM